MLVTNEIYYYLKNKIRMQLSIITFDEYTHVELHAAFRENLKLLRDPYQRFSISLNYKKMLKL